MNRKPLYTLAPLSPKHLTISISTTASSDFKIEGTTLVSYIGSNAKPLIPAGITHIGRFAFGYHAEIKELVLPDSVLSIAELAFAGCNALSSITLPKQLLQIEAYAFLGCNALKELQIPDTVKKLHPKAFFDYSGKISAPHALDKSEALNRRNVHYRVSLSEVSVSPDFELWNNELKKYKGNEKKVRIPDYIKAICHNAFSGNEIVEEIYLPDHITHIGEFAFSNCTSLKRIHLPQKLTSIESGTFYHCKNLQSLIIPDQVTTIEASVFAGCNSLKKLHLPRRLMTIHPLAFANYNHGSITAPGHLRGNAAFYGPYTSFYS